MSTEGTLEVYLSAGLGNRLFQYASVKGLAKKYNLEFKIFAVDYNHEHNFNNYQWFLQKILSENCLNLELTIPSNDAPIRKLFVVQNSH